MQKEIAPDASTTQRDELLVELKNSGVKVVCLAKCTAIEPGQVFFEHEGTAKSAAADNIVIAAGMAPRSAESDSFIGTAESFVPVGDCNSPRILEWATREGYYAAMNL
jgi:NADH dehydrogenase FAD-containing subunit